MARTTAELVAGIIEVDEDIDITPFIDTANMLVTDVCGESEYSDAKLELIERWLSAHFYAVRDPRAIDEAVKGISERTESKVDLGLDFTRYGQQAKILDTEGNLAALDEQSTTVTGFRNVKPQMLHIGGLSCGIDEEDE